MAAAGLLAIAAIAIGCGGDDVEPATELRPTSDEDKADIRGAVDRFNIAAGELDAKLLCNDVLPPSSVSEPERCEAAVEALMRENADNWQPYGTVRRIEVKGDGAKARGVQGESRKTIRFVREYAVDEESEERAGRWYVEVFD